MMTVSQFIIFNTEWQLIEQYDLRRGREGIYFTMGHLRRNCRVCGRETVGLDTDGRCDHCMVSDLGKNECATAEDEPISEEWLSEIGFKWHQLDRQQHKHWLLWLGDALGSRATSFDELGIEVSMGSDGQWFCWLRSDHAGRYSRFIHIRYIKSQAELIGLIEGVTGLSWQPHNVWCGSLRTPETAQRLLAESDRLDRRMLFDGPKWREVEKDDSRGRALPEHMEDSVKNGTSN